MSLMSVKSKDIFTVENTAKVASILNECPRKVEDRVLFLFKWMTDKFLDSRHKVHYPLRFSRSEGINGFHKTSNSLLRLLGTTVNAINNELDLRNTIYNLTRINTLKEEGY